MGGSLPPSGLDVSFDLSLRGFFRSMVGDADSWVVADEVDIFRSCGAVGHLHKFPCMIMVSVKSSCALVRTCHFFASEEVETHSPPRPQAGAEGGKEGRRVDRILR